MITSWITRFSRDECGSIAVWMAGGLSVIMGIGAISVDIGRIYLEEQRLQATADTAALAAVRAFRANEDTAAAAMAYVEKNMPSSIYGSVLSAADVQEGEWSQDTSTFTPGGATPNAVRVRCGAARPTVTPSRPSWPD